MTIRTLLACAALALSAGAQAATFSESVSGDVDAFTAATDSLGQPTRTFIALDTGTNVFTGSINSPSDSADVIPFQVTAGTLSGFTLVIDDVLIASSTQLSLDALNTNGQLFSGSFDQTRSFDQSLSADAGLFTFLIGGGTNVASYRLTLDVTGPATPPAADVPEPATWGMMLLGFGLLGATLRRRRAIPLAA